MRVAKNILADRAPFRFVFSKETQNSKRFVTDLAISRDQRTIFVTMTRDNSSQELDGIVQAFKVTSAKE